MFGLSLRAERKAQHQPEKSVLPNPAAGWETPSALERRLARELEKVLANHIPPHRIEGEVGSDVQGDAIEPVRLEAPDANTATTVTQFVANLETETGNEFHWHSDDADDADLDSNLPNPNAISGRSRAWLKRAKRRERLVQARRIIQGVIVASGVGAFLILTVWPGLS